MPVPNRVVTVNWVKLGIEGGDAYYDGYLTSFNFSNPHGSFRKFTPGTYYLQYASIPPYQTGLWVNSNGIPSSTSSGRSLLKLGTHVIILDLVGGGGGGGGAYIHNENIFISDAYAGGQGGGGGSVISVLIDVAKYSSGIKLVVGAGGAGGSYGSNDTAAKAGGTGGATAIYNASNDAVIASAYGGNGGAAAQSNTSDTSSQAAGSARSPGGVLNEVSGAVFGLHIDGTNNIVTGGAGGRGGRSRDGLIENGTNSSTSGSDCSCANYKWTAMYKNGSSYADLIVSTSVGMAYCDVGKADNTDQGVGSGALVGSYIYGGGGGGCFFGSAGYQHSSSPYSIYVGHGGSGGSVNVASKIYWNSGTNGQDGTAYMYY